MSLRATVLAPCAGGLMLCFAFIAAATSSPPITTQEQGARAVKTAFWVAQTLPQTALGYTNRSEYRAQQVRELITSTTLPVPPTVVTCAAGGSFTYRTTIGPVVTLTVDYDHCATDESGQRTTKNGALIIKLNARLNRLVRVQFSSTTRLYTETAVLLHAPGYPSISTLDFSLSGFLLPDVDDVTLEPEGEFVYALQGWANEENHVGNGTGSGPDPLIFNNTFTFDNVRFLGHHTQELSGPDPRMETRTFFTGGSVEILVDDAFNGLSTVSWKPYVLDITDTLQWSSSDRVLKIDGTVKVNYPESNPGCKDGTYGFRTLEPLVKPGNGFTVGAGKIGLNDTARAEFRSTEPGVTLQIGAQPPVDYNSFDELEALSGCFL